MWCLRKTKPKYFTTNGTTCSKYLRKTSTNNNNRYTVGLLSDDDNVELPENKNLALSRLFSFERKFKSHSTVETSYKDTMQEHISEGHASKLNKTEVKRTTPTTNYLPHHPVPVKNINKPDKLGLSLMQVLKLETSH